MVNAQFADTLANRRHVARIAKFQPLDAGDDFCPSPTVSKTIEPFRKSIGLDNFNHIALYTMVCISSTVVIIQLK